MDKINKQGIQNIYKEHSCRNTKRTLIENRHYCKTKEKRPDLIKHKQIIDLNYNKLWWKGPIFLKVLGIFENKGVIEIDIIEEKSKNTFASLSGIKVQYDLKYWILKNTVTLNNQ